MIYWGLDEEISKVESTPLDGFFQLGILLLIHCTVGSLQFSILAVLNILFPQQLLTRTKTSVESVEPTRPELLWLQVYS